MDPHGFASFGKLGPDPHQVKSRIRIRFWIEVKIQEPCGHWRVCKPVVGDSYRFNEEQDLDPYPHQSIMSDPDPHQSEKARSVAASMSCRFASLVEK